MRIAVASNGKKGLEDTVSDVFGRAKTFTIIDVEDDQVKEVKVIENPGVRYQYGCGPIAVKTLVDLGVDAVIASEFGPSVSSILEQHGVKRHRSRSGIRVEEALKKFLTSSKT